MPVFLDHSRLLVLLIELVRLSAWLLLLSLVFVPLERLFALRPQKFFRKALAKRLGVKRPFRMLRVLGATKSHGPGLF